MGGGFAAGKARIKEVAFVAAMANALRACALQACVGGWFNSTNKNYELFRCWGPIGKPVKKWDHELVVEKNSLHEVMLDASGIAGVNEADFVGAGFSCT